MTDVNGLEDFDSEVTLVTPVTSASAPQPSKPSRLSSSAPSSPDKWIAADDFVRPHAARPAEEEPRLAQQLADTVNLREPELVFASPSRSDSSKWAIALIFGVLIGFAGWYALRGRTHQTPAAPSTPIASPSAPATPAIETPIASSPPPAASGIEAPARPLPTEAPQTQPALPASGARAANTSPPRPSANPQDRDSTQGITGTLVGALRVESRPAGANVYIDDRLAGQTPLWLPRVEAGTHAVRLELDRHRGWATSVRVVSGRPNRVGASLEEQDQRD